MEECVLLEQEEKRFDSGHGEYFILKPLVIQLTTYSDERGVSSADTG